MVTLIYDNVELDLGVKKFTAFGAKLSIIGIKFKFWNKSFLVYFCE